MARIEIPESMNPADIEPRWRELVDDQTRGLAYSPSSMVPNADLTPLLDSYRTKSQSVRQSTPVTTVSYGPKPANTVDVVRPAEPEASPVPVHAFIHGGYWQLLSKKESLFGAPDSLARGWAFAAIDYTLAPHASLDEIVAECRAAIRVLRAEAPALGIDPDRVLVSGSSAGAHLAAMCGIGLNGDDKPAALALVSGVFELEPLIGTYVNDAVGLDPAAAHRNSPLLADPARLAEFPPTVIAWGQNEPDEFKRQSLTMATKLAAAGIEVDAFEVPDSNHFDIIEDVAGAGRLGSRVAATFDAAGS